MKRCWLGISVLGLLMGCGTSQNLPTTSSESCSGGACYQLTDGYWMTEGDIIVGSVEKPPPGIGPQTNTRTGLAVLETISWARWPKGRVPYLIHGTLNNRERVLSAIAHYEEKTNLRFIQRTTQTAYIVFRPWNQGYCRSWIGRTGSAQAIDLDPGCDKRSVIHEIGHAVGFWHEHTRSDRDKYVRINLNNVLAGLGSNFAKQLTYGRLLGPYDYLSIMHYRPYELSKNGQPTVTKLDGSVSGLSNRDGLSEGDIAALKKMYPTAPP